MEARAKTWSTLTDVHACLDIQGQLVKQVCVCFKLDKHCNLIMMLFFGFIEIDRVISETVL